MAMALDQALMPRLNSTTLSAGKSRGTLSAMTTTVASSSPAVVSCAKFIVSPCAIAASSSLRSSSACVQLRHSRVTVKSLRAPPRRRSSLQVKAALAPNDGVRWWEKDGGPNFHDIHSTQEFVEALGNAANKLVVVEFFATWCGSCRALYPKLCRLAAEHPDVEFVKVNFEENKPMCKSLNIKVLPYFHFYRGADGRLEGFSCSLSKLQRIRDAINQHNTERCSIGPPVGAGNIFHTSTNDQAAAPAR